MGFVGWTTYVILVIIKTHTNLTKTVQTYNKVGWKHAMIFFFVSVFSFICMQSLSVLGKWHIETGKLWSFLATVILHSCYHLVHLLGSVFQNRVSLSMQYCIFSVSSFLQLCILLDANASASKHSDLKILEGLSLTTSQFSALIVVKSAPCYNNASLEEHRLQASIFILILCC